jgi:hypothetical protein
MYPLMFHHQCQQRTDPEAPSCALWVPAVTTIPTLSHGSAIVASPNILTALPSQLPHTTNWYAKTRLYHILCQAVPTYIHGCTISMGGCTVNWFLDLAMITNHRLPASCQTKASNHRHHIDKLLIPSPQIIFSILVRSK